MKLHISQNDKTQILGDLEDKPYTVVVAETTGYLKRREDIAAEIVKRWNCHEELLAIMKVQVSRGHQRHGDCYSDDYQGLCACGHDRMKEAIAKAEEKK